LKATSCDHALGNLGALARGDSEVARLPFVACPEIPGLPRREGAARNDGSNFKQAAQHSWRLAR
jgi:hypothetical protein